jgi:hypothetical protein
MNFIITTAEEGCPNSETDNKVEVCASECTIGYSDFHNLMGFTSKKMPNNIL